MGKYEVFLAPSKWMVRREDGSVEEPLDYFFDGELGREFFILKDGTVSNSDVKWLCPLHGWWGHHCWCEKIKAAGQVPVILAKD